MDHKHIHAFADWIETKPILGRSFVDWKQSFMPQYLRHCNDVCRNIFIMYESVEAFIRRLQPHMTWRQAIQDTRLWDDIHEICQQAQTNPEEYFVGSARTSFEKRCRQIYDGTMECRTSE